MKPITITLHPNQIKAIIKHAVLTEIEMVKAVVAAAEQAINDEQIDQAVDSVFDKYDHVFVKLAKK